MPNTATYISIDNGPRGNWKDAHGQAGHVKFELSTSNQLNAPPAGVTVNVPSYSYAAADQGIATSNPLHLVRTTEANGGIRDGIIYAFSNLRCYIDATANGGTVRVAFYFGEYAPGFWADFVITAKDGNTGTTLATKTVTLAEAGAGVYYLWDITGNVEFDMDRSGSSGSGQLGAIFFDSAGGGGGGPLAQNPPTKSAATTTTVTIAWTDPTGGTAPRTAQLETSSTANGTYATAGGTSPQTINPGLPPGGHFFGRVVATDSATPTPATVTTPTRIFRTAEASFAVLVVGDSITRSLWDPAAQGTAKTALEASVKHRTPVIVQRGQDGTDSGTDATTGWHPSSTSGLLSAAISAGQAAGATLATVCLGMNDARPARQFSQATHVSNMVAICNALTGAGFTVLLHSIPCPISGLGGGADNTQVALVESYNTARATIIATANAGVLYGDRMAFKAFADNPAWSTDGVHPVGGGSTFLANAWVGSILWAAGFLGQFTVTGGATNKRSPFDSPIRGD